MLAISGWLAFFILLFFVPRAIASVDAARRIRDDAKRIQKEGLVMQARYSQALSNVYDRAIGSDMGDNGGVND